MLVDYFRGQNVAARRLTLPPPKFPSVEEAKDELGIGTPAHGKI